MKMLPEMLTTSLGLGFGVQLHCLLSVTEKSVKRSILYSQNIYYNSNL